MTFPGIAYYNGSKFALEGIYGSLGKEVEPLGIFVTAIEPGMFRTDWAGRPMVRTGRSVADYGASFGPVCEARAARSGKQMGNPAKAGLAILKLIESENPLAHLLLGPDALRLVREGMKEVGEWEGVTTSTNFDE